MKRKTCNRELKPTKKQRESLDRFWKENQPVLQMLYKQQEQQQQREGDDNEN